MQPQGSVKERVAEDPAAEERVAEDTATEEHVVEDRCSYGAHIAANGKLSAGPEPRSEP